MRKFLYAGAALVLSVLSTASAQEIASNMMQPPPVKASLEKDAIPEAKLREIAKRAAETHIIWAINETGQFYHMSSVNVEVLHDAMRQCLPQVAEQLANDPDLPWRQASLDQLAKSANVKDAMCAFQKLQEKRRTKGTGVVVLWRTGTSRREILGYQVPGQPFVEISRDLAKQLADNAR